MNHNPKEGTMRRIIAALVAAAALAVPAAASAHFEYYDVTINGSPWSNTFVSANGGQTTLGCWQTATVGVGQTKYVYNTGSGGPTHFGLTVAIDFSHFHPFDSDFVTGPETRQFSLSTTGTTLGTRRVYYTDTSVSHPLPVQAVKFVNQAGAKNVVVRANC